MAIARKPKPAAEPRAERDIEALINKGGSVATGNSKTKSTNVILRLPPGLLERVDVAVESRSLRIPRHTWLLEAVLEKLDREMSR